MRKDSIGKWKDLAEKNILANDEIIKLAYEKNADAVVGVTTSAYAEVSGDFVMSSVHYITTGTAVRIRKKM